MCSPESVLIQLTSLAITRSFDISIITPTKIQWQPVANKTKKKEGWEVQKKTLNLKDKQNEYWLGNKIETSNRSSLENENIMTTEKDDNGTNHVEDIKPRVCLLNEIANDQYVLRSVDSE